MSIEKGKFIVIEGTDGSGKGTQIFLLKENLKKIGIQVELMDFPQYYTTFFGGMVGRYLKGEFGSLLETDPHLVSLIFAGDRWQAKDKIIQSLEQGTNVLANRYTGSNMAFQSARVSEKDREDFLCWLEELEYRTFQIPREDMVVFLHVPAEISQQLVDKKEQRGYTNSKRDIHEENLDYQKRVEEMYFRLADRNRHWIVVECCDEKGELLPPQDIQALVLAAINETGLLGKLPLK